MPGTACGGTASVAGAPDAPASEAVAALLRPFHLPAPAGDAAIVALVALALLVALACFAFRRVGVTTPESLALLVLAPLVAHVEHDVWQPSATATVAFNAAGFLVPCLLALKMTGRVPLIAALVALAVGSVAAYASSYAVPNEGVLLYYRIPAIASGALAFVLARGARERIGPLAFLAGAGGVIVGADAMRIRELLATSEPHRIVVGGAGVLDGIFLVGLLAVVVGLFTDSIVRHAKSAVSAARGEAHEPRAPPAREAARDVGGLS